jgi:hypothetical protein
MRKLLRALFGTTSTSTVRPVRKSNLALEQLEDRLVPTVTYGGGAVLPNVEVQALYYGSDWWNNSYYYNQTGFLEGYLNNAVHSTYMDMLGNAGYGVGRGSFNQGWVNGASIDKSQYLSDGQLQNALLSNIDAGNLQSPDSNRLYVIYVEDNVVVGNSQSNSSNAFLGYHSSFNAWTWNGSWWNYNDIRYAVIPYAGGSNLQVSWLSTLNSMTLTTSHELAEAVTDPDPTSGWNDNAYSNGEVGDLANAQTVFLNGYAVQRIADKNDQAMTPAGARAINPVNFVLRTDGSLYMSNGSTLTYLSGSIASISDQGIDNYGHAMIDAVTTYGYAYEYHEGSGWTYLTSGVKMAKAGQGVSYILYNNGAVYEYKDWGGWSGQLDSNVTSIDAGTDRYGVNMFTEVWYGYGYEHSDSTGWHYIASGVQSVSAGQQGIIDYLTTGGNAYWFNEASGSTSFLGSGVIQVTAGTDQFGNYMIDMLYSGGNLYEYRVGSGWSFLDSSVQSIGKGHAGVVDMVFTWGDAYAHDSSGWYYLTYNAKTAA